ncbi:nucleotidyltransferase domain-containing protein [bacterium]|nr:nucleotidyltransferase domain-containing protein [bacterium]
MAKRYATENKEIIKEKILRFYEIIKRLYPVKKIILYGSYAKDTTTKESDIDVGVVIDLPDDTNTIKITSRLFHYASNIDVSIEPLCILWSEYQNCEKGSILSEIIKTGVVIA